MKPSLSGPVPPSPPWDAIPVVLAKVRAADEALRSPKSLDPQYLRKEGIMYIIENDGVLFRGFNILDPIPSDATLNEVEFHIEKLRALIITINGATFADKVATMHASLADCENRLRKSVPR